MTASSSNRGSRKTDVAGRDMLILERLEVSLSAFNQLGWGHEVSRRSAICIRRNGKPNGDPPALLR